MVLRPKTEVVLPEFLPFFMQSDLFMMRALEISVGSLSPTINWRTMAQQEFALPSLAEQRRIASVLATIENTKRKVQDACLAAQKLWVPLMRSFIGVETSDEEVLIIRGKHKTTTNSWPIMRITDICVSNRQGVQVGPIGGSVSSKYFADEGIPILKINNITDLGKLDLSEVVYLNTDQAEKLADRYSVLPGDVVTASQATIGRTAIVPSHLSGAIISQHLIRIAVDSNICLPEWLHACFYTPLVLRQIYSAIQGGTRAGLNTGDVRNLLVPIPPQNIQEQYSHKLQSARQVPEQLGVRFLQIQKLQKELLYQMMEGQNV